MTYAFVSYSRKDSDYVTKLVEKLRAEGFEVWIDNRIDAGEEWFNAIEDAVLGCGAFVVVMTPAARQSRWVSKEIIIALDERKRIFPLLLDGRRFGILADVQFKDVTDGKLPPPDFFDDLAKVIPRGKSKPEAASKPVTHSSPDAAFPKIQPGRPLVYPGPGNPVDVGSIVERAGLEYKIIERLRALLDATPGKNPLDASNETYCKVGRAFVYANRSKIYASIVVLRSEPFNDSAPGKWVGHRFAGEANQNVFSKEQIKGNTFVQHKYIQRDWERENYKDMLDEVALEIIEVNERLGLKREEITIECKGF